MRDVAILGMHRSGTSALAGCLHLIGLHLGPPEHLFPPAPENPKGFWENSYLSWLNDRVMMAMDGGTWREPPKIKGDWQQEEWAAGEIEKAHTLISEMRARGPRRPVGFKDPRSCITLPFWRHVFGERLAAVFIWRPFQEVWQSLRKRDPSHFTEGRAAELWLRYNGDALKNLAGLPVYCLSYQQLLDYPEHHLWRIRTFLSNHQVAGLYEPPGPELHSFLNHGLCHWNDDGVKSALSWSIVAGMAKNLRTLPAESDCFEEIT